MYVMECKDTSTTGEEAVGWSHQINQTQSEFLGRMRFVEDV